MFPPPQPLRHCALMAIGNATPAPRLWAQYRRSSGRWYFSEKCIFGGLQFSRFLQLEWSFLWVIQYSMKIRHPLGPFLSIWVDTYYHYCPEYGENMKLYPYNKQRSRVGRQTKTMWTFLDGSTLVSNFLLSSLSSAKIFCFRAKHNHSAKRDLSVVNNCGAKCQMSCVTVWAINPPSILIF